MFDFTSAGLKDSLRKVGSVAIYIIASMAVIGLGMFVANQSVSWQEVKVAMEVGGANLILVFLEKWLSTSEPVTPQL